MWENKDFFDIVVTVLEALVLVLKLAQKLLAF